jgi:hypothetical protein
MHILVLLTAQKLEERELCGKELSEPWRICLTLVQTCLFSTRKKKNTQTVKFTADLFMILTDDNLGKKTMV